MLTTHSVKIQSPLKKKAKVQPKSKIKPKPKRRKIKSGVRDLRLLDLPNEILNMVFKNLDLADCAVLALACKILAIKLDYNGLLDWDETADLQRLTPAEGIVKHFARYRLGREFFPPELRYCFRCSKYVPRRESYWKKKLFSEFGKSCGETGCKLKSWSERCHPAHPDAVTLLDQKLIYWAGYSSKKAYPRCVLLSSGGASW
jgi:F-box domain